MFIKQIEKPAFPWHQATKHFVLSVKVTQATAVSSTQSQARHRFNFQPSPYLLAVLQV